MTKDNKIRLIIYPIIILLAGVLSFYLFKQYRKEHPKPKLLGVDFCATPEEAVRRYAEALMKADREEALKYVYKPPRDIWRWEGYRRRLYEDYTDEELTEYGKKLLNGWSYNKWQTGWGGAEWGEIVMTQEGKKEHTFMLRVVNTVSEGWKID
ncbi:MAG: hypothetical protein V1891_02005 [bacterium]